MSSFQHHKGFVLPFLLMILTIILIILLSIIRQISMVNNQRINEVKYFQSGIILSVPIESLIDYFYKNQARCIVSLHSAEWFKDEANWPSQSGCYYISNGHRIQILYALISEQPCMLLSDRPVRLYELISRDATTGLIVTYIIAIPNDLKTECLSSSVNIHSPILVKYAW